MPRNSPSAALNARLDELIRKVDRLHDRFEANAARAEAIARFQCAGEMAPPMSISQVAAVLNTTSQGVQTLVKRKRLTRRSSYPPAAFHPDDVRVFLAAAEK